MSDPRINTVLELIPKNKSILDIGCAQNPEIHYQITKMSKKAVGIDINKSGLDVFRKKGLEVYEMSAESINLKETFDCIIAGELIEHVSNPGQFLDSMANHLKLDGQIILTTPNISSLFLYGLVVVANKTQDPTHVFYFDKKNLEELVTRHNLKITQTKYIAPNVKLHGNGIFFKIIFLIATFLANFGFIFSKRLFGSYLLVVLKKK